ncbi:MAG: O-methyltransferase [Armatimonadota bacterium]
MDTRLTDLLRDIEDKAGRNGSISRLARETGQFLNILAKAARARNILEVGTAHGYLTLWLAEAAAASGGTVTTIENDLLQLENARKTLARSPHAELIHLVQGDALELLPVVEGPFDFVVLDADPTQALHYLHMLSEKLHSGGLVVCQKAISKAGALAEYLSYVHSLPGLESTLAPVGDGLEITYKVP